VLEIHEPVLVQTLIAELPLKLSMKRVLVGLPRSMEMQRHLVSDTPTDPRRGW